MSADTCYDADRKAAEPKGPTLTRSFTALWNRIECGKNRPSTGEYRRRQRRKTRHGGGTDALRRQSLLVLQRPVVAGRRIENHGLLHDKPGGLSLTLQR